MANGYWGSRLPISNLLCTKFIFTAVQWRIATRRVRNAVRRFLGSDGERLVNGACAAETLNRWLELGYEKLNMGGGRKNLNGFVNIDFVYFEGVERQVVANIEDLSFIPNACISHIHTNHVLEHFSQEQLEYQLKEYHRILRDKGVLSVRCPNALGVALGFWLGLVLEEDHREFVALGFPEDEDFGNPADRWVERDFFGLLHWLYGDMGNARNQHLTVITPSKIERSIVRAGFDILRMTRPEAANIVVVARKTDI